MKNFLGVHQQVHAETKNKSNSNLVYGFNSAQTMVEVLKHVRQRSHARQRDESRPKASRA